MTYILFDIGGTHTRITQSRDGVTFDTPIIFPTPRSFNEAIETIKNTIETIKIDTPIRAVAGGIRGVLSPDKSMLVSDNILTDWVNKPLKKQLARICSADVFLENDTALVGLGEAVAGGGQGQRIVGYITVSTGVGGVRIVDGGIDERAVGFEPGKQIIDPDNTLCPDCPGNTLEAYVSGTAVEERFGKKPYTITDTAIWKEIAHFLAIGVHNIIVEWSPDILVLGGSMIVKAPGIDITQVQHEVTELLTAFPKAPPLVKAELADSGGLHGALYYLKQCVQ